MDMLKVLTEAGPWAVSAILLFVLSLFITGKVVVWSVMERMMTELVSKTQANQEKLMLAHTEKSGAEHAVILAAVSGGGKGKL